MVGMSVTIDPRRHDAVLLRLGGAVNDSVTLTERLQRAGVQVDTVAPDSSSAGLVHAAAGLAVRPGRCVVLTDSESGVTAARSAGFALVIGVGCDGGDAVVAGPGEVGVRTGDRPMSALPDAMAALDGSALRAALEHPAVFFDFDGTLSDIVDDPDAAQPVAGALDALAALATRCPVAVLSGRDLADVRTRVGLDGIWYAGSHGFELVGPDGSHHQNDAAVDAVLVLAGAAGSLDEKLGAIPGIMVEHKRFAVAVHYRNAARDRVGEVLAAVREAGRRRGLRVTTGREVIELRPEIDWDKGRTLRWILDRLAGVTPLFIGDDITDEDAFDAVADLEGTGIVVRHNDDGDRATAAHYALDSPSQVAEFTARLAKRLAG
nr:trehalose-phosphatase [Mycolicibacter longobardus]